MTAFLTADEFEAKRSAGRLNALYARCARLQRRAVRLLGDGELGAEPIEAPGRRGFVYLVHCRTTELSKIGTATDVERRIRDIQSTSPTHLDIVGVACGGRQEEACLHQWLADRRVRGEWFRLKRDEIRDLTFVVRSNLVIPTVSIIRDGLRHGAPHDEIQRVLSIAFDMGRALMARKRRGASIAELMDGPEMTEAFARIRGPQEARIAARAMA